jgi:hypothetical protein
LLEVDKKNIIRTYARMQGRIPIQRRAAAAGPDNLAGGALEIHDAVFQLLVE